MTNLKVTNGLVGFIQYHFQILFQILHLIDGTFTEGIEIVEKILCLSKESIELSKHKEIGWTLSNLLCIHSCPIEITDHEDENEDEDGKGSLFLFSSSSCSLQEKISSSPFSSSSSSMPMGLKQNSIYGRSNAVLKFPLEEKSLFRIEYKINEVEDENCALKIGCVIYSLCPFPKNEYFGEIEGSACLSSMSDDALVSFGGDYDSSFHSDWLGPSFSLAEGNFIAAELDLRDGKKTLAFSINKTAVPFYVTNLPSSTPLYCTVELRYPFSLSFISFQKGSKAKPTNIPLVGKSGKWK